MPKALPMTAEATPAPTHLLLVDDDRLILATGLAALAGAWSAWYSSQR